MGLFEKLSKVGSALKTAGNLVSPPSKEPERKYRIAITLDVRAENKKALEQAVKSAQQKIERVGFELVGQLVGVSGGEIKVDKIGVAIKAAAKEKKPKDERPTTEETGADEDTQDQDS